ncbi:hypothetical protein GCM10027416_10640 [Okibacterium endophyticum]
MEEVGVFGANSENDSPALPARSGSPIPAGQMTRPRGVSLLFRAVIVAVFSLMLVAGVSGASFAAPDTPDATPETTPDGSAPPTPSEPPASSRPPAPAPVTITSPTAGAFFGTGDVTVSGTKAPGTSVQILAGAPRENVCTVEADQAGTFTCTATVPSAETLSLTAVEIDGASGARRESSPVTISVLAPPTIDGVSPQLSSGFVSGTGYPGATLRLSTESGESWDVTVPASGQWSHGGPRELVSGRYTLTAVQSTAFSAPETSQRSTPVTIDLDKDAPAPPRITAPSQGQSFSEREFRISGNGESGASLIVYAMADGAGSRVACETRVQAGRWQCTGAVPSDGTFSISAFQQDAAGNPSATSNTVTVTVGDASPAPSPAPTPGDRPSTSPENQSESNPTPGPSEPAPGPSPSESPEAGPGTPAQPPSAEPWAARTPFTTSVPSALATGDALWLRSVLLALAAVALLLVPARMLATTVSGAISHRRPRLRVQLTGRNRRVPPPDPAAGESAVRAYGAGMAAAGVGALLVMFAHPIHGELAYLRLYLASLIAVTLVNGAALLPVLLARRSPHTPPVVRVAPRYLVAIIGTAVLSRVVGLEPALIFGLVFSVGFGSDVADDARAPRARLALTRIAALLAVGVSGWLVSTAVGAPTGVWLTLLAETANITALTAITSAALLLIPLGQLSGRMILGWSKPVWFAAALVVFTLLFGLFSPAIDSLQARPSALGVAVMALVFAAVGASTWVWRRLVQSEFSGS